MTKKILFVITILFFAAMLFLTLFAEKIHTASLPKVTAARPERRSFPYEFIDANGERHTGSIEKNAVPRSMLESGVFVIYSAEKNGTKRDFVRLVDKLQTGEEADGYIEVVSGITIVDKIAFSADGKLFNGCEVTIVDKESVN